MSSPYELSGRTRQKARTRAALVEATRELLAAGEVPTVESAADRAAVSRSTAYRYFANRRALLGTTFPEIETASLLGDAPPEDVEARLDVVLDRMGRQLLEHEAALRAQLRLSLEPAGDEDDPLPLRQGRALGWLEDALAPLRAHRGAPPPRRLALAVRATFGIEALVWLTDVGGVTREEAVAIMGDSARALLRDALR